MIRFDTACNICGCESFREFGARSDGIPVVLCSRCGHGVVQSFPENVAAIYEDQYFSEAGDNQTGYSDYAYVAEHSLAWAAALFHLLKPAGKVLDIGCANGHLLRTLDAGQDNGYERFGIELNHQAAEQCRSAGITILASTVLDEQLREHYSETFSFEFAIAVFEHIPDFKAAVKAAVDLLTPEGILLFEVPVISPSGPDEPWLKTSLEHIHYPSEQSLEHLFREELGLKLYGCRLEIRNFGNTYIGLTSKSEEIAQHAGECVLLWRTASADSLSPDQARFRWMLDLIHAANVDPAVLSLYRHLDASDLSPLMLRRLCELWLVDITRSKGVEERLQNTLTWLTEVEQSRDWHAAESLKRDAIINALNKGTKSQ